MKKNTLQLGYSTNVHPGEDMKAVYRSLKDYTLPIRKRVFGTEPCGLELRLGIGSAKQLSSRKARLEFRDFLQDSGLVLFSVNAYPLSDFHARRVKETVYQPSWAQPQRASWTARIARIVDEVAPEGIKVSISTLGGCFRGHGHGPTVFRKLATHYLKALEAFLEINDGGGRQMVLAVEPEPETTFETAADVISFFEDYLLPAAFTRWKKRGTKSRIEADLRSVFTVNIDTCHLSVLFEDQVSNLRQLQKAGLELGKVHVTNAVALKNPFRSPTAFRDLRNMNEPRYFHQFCGCDEDGQAVWRGTDLDQLPAKLKRGTHPDISEIRSHFHVPLYLKKYRHLHTTRDDTERALIEVIKQRSCSHLVFETYTWPILAGGKKRKQKLINGITREYRWLLETVEKLSAR